MASKEKVRWLLAVGGGSVLDAAKAIALITTNPGPLDPYFKGRKAERPPLPVIAIPTTSGTGSEVTPWAIVTDVRAGDKFVLSMPELFPQVAILDPALTATMPDKVTVDTGLTALGHAVDALLSTRRSAMTDLLARDALVRIVKQLPIAHQAPQDPAARGELQLAALQAGWASANTASLVPQALSTPITMRSDLAHGRATALLLPAFLERVGQSEGERVGEIGENLGSKGDPASALRAFIESLGVAPRLGAYGVRGEDIPSFATQAKGKRQVACSPESWDEAALLEIYRRSL